MKNVIFSITRHSHPFYLKTPGLISFLKLIGFPSTITFVSKLIPQPPLFLLLLYNSSPFSFLFLSPVLCSAFHLPIRTHTSASVLAFLICCSLDFSIKFSAADVFTAAFLLFYSFFPSLLSYSVLIIYYCLGTAKVPCWDQGKL